LKKIAAAVLATAVVSTLATTAMAAPTKVVEVKQKDGTVRLDVADRPSNGTVGAGSDTILVTDSIITPEAYTRPSSIRVGMRSNNNPSNPISYVSVVPWYDYNIDVLPNEWIGGWPMESLKAGAMGIKMYAWYHILHPKYSTCDVDNTVNSQVYKPNSRYSRTTTAVDTMSGIGLYRNGVMFETQYRAGTYDASKPGTDIMSQNGTHYFADLGKTWSYMLSYYYTGSSIFYY
jgi:peptidoglycan hydrolase-like amidase